MDTITLPAVQNETVKVKTMLNTANALLIELKALKKTHNNLKRMLKKTSLEILGQGYGDKFEFIHALNKSLKRVQILVDILKSHNKTLLLCATTTPEDFEKLMHKHQAILANHKAFVKDFKRLKTQLTELIEAVRNEKNMRLLLDRREQYAFSL